MDHTAVAMTNTVVDSCFSLYGSVTEEDIRRAADSNDKMTRLLLENVDFEMEGVSNNLANLLHRRSFESVVLRLCAGPLVDDWGSTKRLTLEHMSIPPRYLLLGENLLALELFATSLSEQGASSLGEELGSTSCRLEELDLTESRFVGDGVRRFARGVQSNQGPNTSLQRLIISECNLIDEQVAQIVQAFHHHPSIQELDLSFNKCRSGGMDALVQLLETTKLAKLAIGFQAFGEAKRIDLRSLSATLATNNSFLKDLDLGGNSLRDDPDMPLLVRTLCASDTLEILDLSENRFTNTGIAIMAQHLGDMISLRHLVLEDNRFDGAGMQLLANGMTSNHVLEEIELEGRLRLTEAWRPLAYHLDVNWGGRGRLLGTIIMPLSLWPLVLERTNKPKKHGMRTRMPAAADIIYFLLRDRPSLLLHRQ